MAMIMDDTASTLIMDVFFGAATKPTTLDLKLWVTDATPPATGDTPPSVTYATPAGAAGNRTLIYAQAVVSADTSGTGGSIVTFVHWPSASPAISWTFSVAYQQVPLADPVKIYGYTIFATGGTYDGQELFYEKFTSPFEPSAGSTLTIIPKIYFGNVGDF